MFFFLFLSVSCYSLHFFSGIIAYGYPFYTVKVRDEMERGRPVAHFIMNAGNEANLSLALKQLKDGNLSWHPL